MSIGFAIRAVFHAAQLPEWSAWALTLVALVLLIAVPALIGRGPGAWVRGAVVVGLSAGVSYYIAATVTGESGDFDDLKTLILLPPDSVGTTDVVRHFDEYLLEIVALLDGVDVIRAAGAQTDAGLSVDSGTAQSFAAEAGAGRGETAPPVLQLGVEGEDPIRLAANFREDGVNRTLLSVELTPGFERLADFDLPLARSVASALALGTGPEIEARIVANRPRSRRLFEAYLGVLGNWRELGDGIDSAQAGTQLDEVLRLDPEFMPALALAANVALAAPPAPGSGADADDAWLRRAETLAQSALDSSIRNPRAHQALGKAFQFRRDGSGAAEQFGLAFESGANDPWILLDYALFSARAGQCRDARSAANRADRVARATAATRTRQGRVYQVCGDLDAAAGSYTEATRLGADETAWMWLAATEASRNDHERALEALGAWETSRGNAGSTYAHAAYIYSLLGAGEDAERLVAQIDTRAVGLAADALARLALGDYRDALRVLERLAVRPIDGADRELAMDIAANVWLDPVLNEPAFRDVRERLGMD